MRYIAFLMGLMLFSSFVYADIDSVIEKNQEFVDNIGVETDNFHSDGTSIFSGLDFLGILGLCAIIIFIIGFLIWIVGFFNK